MIGICTDSGAQLPAELIARYDIEVVPITVTVDGVSYLEHIDLDADAFYDHFSGGAPPAVATAAPSPARFEEAYRALAERGATLDRAAEVAETVAQRAGNIFVVGALDLARAGGRLVGDATAAAAILVLRLEDGKMGVIGEARSVDEAADVMAHAVLTAGNGLRVGVGTSDPSSASIAEALTARVAGSPSVLEVIQYRVGPSVGAPTGPGTAGAVFYAQP